MCFVLQWIGITLSGVGDYEGNKKKINDAYVIKEEFEVKTSIFSSIITQIYGNIIQSKPGTSVWRCVILQVFCYTLIFLAILHLQTLP